MVNSEKKEKGMNFVNKNGNWVDLPRVQPLQKFLFNLKSNEEERWDKTSPRANLGKIWVARVLLLEIN